MTQAPQHLTWSEYEGRECIRIRGLSIRDVRDPSRLAVFPDELVKAGVDITSFQPIAGSIVADGKDLCFVPRFPFVAGLEYALVLPDPQRVLHIRRPARAGVATTVVEAMYPTAGAVPFNLLKFYIHFSAPMSEGWSTRAVHVHRADTGKLLVGVFHVGRSELWDRGRRRLTLLLDPGRIKRGLGPHEAEGYPLNKGVPVTLTIDSEFRDAAGLPLRESFTRRYNVGPAARRHVDPKRWKYVWPAAGSTDPVSVKFDRPLDRALLEHCLQVATRSGAAVPGAIAVGKAERLWQFRPEKPWRAGSYKLAVDPKLEDLAGNSLVRVFDRDMTRAREAPASNSPTIIPFTCAVAR